MYKLFYSPGACSMAIHVTLHECGLPVTLEKVDLHAPGPRPAELLKYNPRGQVPTLVEGEQAMVEGAAILISVCEQAKSPLLPASGHARREALQWLMFGNSSLHPAYGAVMGLMHATIDASSKEKLIEAAIGRINSLWQIVETRLSSSPYLAGSEITVGDILVTVIANWSGMLPKPVTLGPKTKALLKLVSSRPAFQKVLSEEHVEYKAAA